MPVEPPYSRLVVGTPLRHDITALVSASSPDLVGPVISLLLVIEALTQGIADDDNACAVACLDHPSLVNLRARLTEGDKNVTNALLRSLTSLDRFRDAMALAEGFLLMDRCLAALPAGDLRRKVQDFADRLRLTLLPGTTTGRLTL